MSLAGREHTLSFLTRLSDGGRAVVEPGSCEYTDAVETLIHTTSCRLTPVMFQYAVVVNEFIKQVMA